MVSAIMNHLPYVSLKVNTESISLPFIFLVLIWMKDTKNRKPYRKNDSVGSDPKMKNN